MWPELSAGVTHYQTVFSREPNKIELKKKNKKKQGGVILDMTVLCVGQVCLLISLHILKKQYIY